MPPAMDDRNSNHPNACPGDRVVAVALGQFDGVHLGHQAVLRRAIEEARGWGGEAAALTFEPRVDVFFLGARAPKRISRAAETVELLRRQGLAAVAAWPFDEALAALAPARFLQRLKAEFPALRCVVGGDDCSFGAGGAGNAATFARHAREAAPDAPLRGLFVPPVLDAQGRKISSTLVRQAVAEGDVASAQALLGRPFSVAGPVVHGRAVGRTRGLPTANVDVPSDQLLPAPGVYAVEVAWAGMPPPPGLATAWRGGAFVANPADCRQALYKSPVEVHIPGFSGDLYGKTLVARFTRRIRPFIPFASEQDAIRQIHKDLSLI